MKYIIILALICTSISVKSQQAKYSISPDFPCYQLPTTLMADTTGRDPNVTYTTWYHVNTNTPYNFGPPPQYGVPINLEISLPYGWHTFKLFITDSLNNQFPTYLDSGSKTFFVDSICNTSFVRGNVYYDINSNGIQDGNELGAPNIPVLISDINSTYTTYTDASGEYSKGLSIGSYLVNSDPGVNYSVTQPSGTGTYTVSLSSITDSSVNNNFGINTDSTINNLSISISNTALRPGFGGNIFINVKNEGTLPQTGNIMLFLDSTLQFNSSNPIEDSLNNNILYLTTPNIAPSQIKRFNIQVDIDSTVQLGTGVGLSAFVFPILIDHEPSNNYDTLSAIIVGSYDPNDKLVFPMDDSINIIEPGGFLTYTIRFQNTGTYFAEHVRIKDQLRTELDWSTFQMLSASHPYSYQINNSGLIIWQFDDIMLPTEQDNEPESHGFVKFRIQADSGLSLGTEIKNSAEIFFDFNPAIYTDTISSTLDTLNIQVGVKENEFTGGKIKLFPNPVNSELNVQFFKLQNQNAIFNIFNINGQFKKSFPVDYKLNTIDISNFKTGMYLFEIHMNGDIKRGKFIKQ